MNVPNQLTVLRFILALFYLGLMSWGTFAAQLIGLIVFIIAAITDFLDGAIARRHNLHTNFGKLMDPLADKVLMLAAFIMMMELPTLWVPGWAVVLILAREFLVTGLRTIAASQGQVLAAMNSGKAKTVVQILFVIAFSLLALALDLWRGGYPPSGMLALSLEDATYYVRWASLISFVAITAFTVQSGIAFTRANWHRLHLDEL